MLLDITIRLVSVMGAAWMSISVLYANGEELALRLWWQTTRALGLDEWRISLPATQERLTGVSDFPAASAALGCLSAFFFLAALFTLRRSRHRRRHWPRGAGAA